MECFVYKLDETTTSNLLGCCGSRPNEPNRSRLSCIFHSSAWLMRQLFFKNVPLSSMVCASSCKEGRSTLLKIPLCLVFSAGWVSWMRMDDICLSWFTSLQVYLLVRCWHGLAGWLLGSCEYELRFGHAPGGGWDLYICWNTGNRMECVKRCLEHIKETYNELDLVLTIIHLLDEAYYVTWKLF